MKKVKFAVVIAGCGVFDGAEITETVMSLYAVEKNGAEFEAFAPDIDQYHVINHLAGAPVSEKRNVLTEAARIVRGKIKPLTEYNSDNFDVLLFPGGFGVAKNFCDFAFKGAEMTVNAHIKDVILKTYSAKKPIGALCIAPVLLAKVLGDVTLTLGAATTASAAAEKMGARHVVTDHAQIVVDKDNKLVTCPCYMLDAEISHIADGTDAVVKALIDLI